MISPQIIGCREDVADVGREIGIGKLAFAAADAGEVKSQHGDTVRRKPFGDACCGKDVLAAREAVSKQSASTRFGRQIETRRQFARDCAGELNLR